MKLLSYIIIFAILLSSCKKETSFPEEPHIEFKSYDSYSIDSADCWISFTDGDGDIGILSTDTTSEYNLRMVYYYKDTASGGQFVPYDYTPSDSLARFDTLAYNYKIDNLTPDGQYKALEGDIKVRLRSSFIYYPLHTVVKFQISLWDRAGHKSNTVETNEIIVPK